MLQETKKEEPRNESIIPAGIWRVRQMIEGYIAASKRLGKLK